MSTITTPASPVSDTLKSAEAAAIAILAAPINSALTSIQANPTTLNVVGQVAAIQGELIAAGPALETLGIKDAAAALQSVFNGYIAKLTAPATTASAS